VKPVKRYGIVLGFISHAWEIRTKITIAEYSVNISVKALVRELHILSISLRNWKEMGEMGMGKLILQLLPLDERKKPSGCSISFP
jgi:hypothetical protein